MASQTGCEIVDSELGAVFPMNRKKGMFSSSRTGKTQTTLKKAMRATRMQVTPIPKSRIGYVLTGYLIWVSRRQDVRLWTVSSEPSFP